MVRCSALSPKVALLYILEVMGMNGMPENGGLDGLSLFEQKNKNDTTIIFTHPKIITQLQTLPFKF